MRFYRSRFIAGALMSFEILYYYYVFCHTFIGQNISSNLLFYGVFVFCLVASVARGLVVLANAFVIRNNSVFLRGFARESLDGNFHLVVFLWHLALPFLFLLSFSFLGSIEFLLLQALFWAYLSLIIAKMWRSFYRYEKICNIKNFEIEIGATGDLMLRTVRIGGREFCVDLLFNKSSFISAFQSRSELQGCEL